jgi:hypothetical protein
LPVYCICVKNLSCTNELCFLHIYPVIDNTEPKNMKIVVPVILSITLICSCKKDPNNEITSCGVHDPLTELEWLAAITEPCDESEICQTGIFQGIYNNETVFYAFLQGPLCEPAYYIALRDCNGDILKEYYWKDRDDFVEEVDSVETIYSCWD